MRYQIRVKCFELESLIVILVTQVCDGIDTHPIGMNINIRTFGTLKFWKLRILKY